MIQLDKRALIAAFDRAAKKYNKYDLLQRKSAKMLLTLLKARNFTTVLDAGCGPGRSSLFWRKIGSRVTAIDLSSSMLTKARDHQVADTYIIADIEALPISDEQFDLVWSHLVVQWCTSLHQTLYNLYRVTRPGGKIAFTTLLEGSLYELNQAWNLIDEESHINNFLTKKEIENILSIWNYYSYVQVITLCFKNAQNAMRSLKGVGANYLTNRKNSKKILTKGQLKIIEQNWPKNKELYPLTYVLFYGIIERE